MTDHTPSPKFLKAASFLANDTSASNASLEIKLELYGLYKYITVARNPNISRPSFFDMSGKAKWDAWCKAGKTYESSLLAEERYLAIAHDFGWKDGIIAGPEASKPTANTDIDLDDLDNAEDDQPSTNAGSMGGLGVYVSSMSAGKAEDESLDLTMHGLTLSNDTTGLLLLLQSDPDIDVNQPDEYGYTPLHLAADRGHGKVIELLLKHGANASLKDSDDFTAMELAEAAGHQDLAAFLSAMQLRLRSDTSGVDLETSKA